MYTCSAIYLQDRISYKEEWLGPSETVKEYTCSSVELGDLILSLQNEPCFSGNESQNEKWEDIRMNMLRHIEDKSLEDTMKCRIWPLEFMGSALREVRSQCGGRCPWVRVMNTCLYRDNDNEFLVLVYVIHTMYGKRISIAGVLGCLSQLGNYLHTCAMTDENRENRQRTIRSMTKLATVADLILFNRIGYRGVVEKLLSTQELLLGNPDNFEKLLYGYKQCE